MKWSNLDGGKGNNLCVHNIIMLIYILIHLHDIENENGLFEKAMGGGIGTVHEILITSLKYPEEVSY